MILKLKMEYTLDCVKEFLFQTSAYRCHGSDGES